jgi:hypothetical protein
VQILLDQNVPVGVRKILNAHHVRTVYQMGWADLSNGDLLDQAEKTGIEIFVTCDQNIAVQQNLTGRQIAAVILATNRWSVIEARAGAVGSAIANASYGACTVVAVGGSRHKRRLRP